MTRKLTALGLALMAAFTISAMAAASAQAAASFTAGGAGLAITGSQLGELVFTTTHGTLKASSVTFSGTTTGATSPDLTVTPTITGAKFAGLKAEVTMKSCYFTFTAVNTIAGDANRITATAHLECKVAGDAMTVEIPGSKCVVTYPPQTIEDGIVQENIGTATNMEILNTLNIVGLDYNVDEPTLCPNPSMITSHTEEKLASLVGEVTLTAATGGLTVH